MNGDASGGVSGSGSLKLLSLTNAAEQRWIGVEGIDLSFGVDLNSLNIEVSNGSLLLNQGPEGETKLDWSSADVTAGGAPFALSTLPEGDWTSISLYVTGDASVAFGDLGDQLQDTSSPAGVRDGSSILSFFFVWKPPVEFA